MSKWDEIEIIGRAYRELKALDRDGQLRAIKWLDDRLYDDHAKAMTARETEARNRIAQRKQEAMTPTTHTESDKG